VNYWLLKSEPTAYSIDDLNKEKSKITHWDGVRNYQARNFMRDSMKIGDEGFFYHSNTTHPGIVGIVKVVREGYVDFTAFDPQDHHYDAKSDQSRPRWMMVDVQLARKFEHPILLSELRLNPKLRRMQILQKGNRLSITPVTKEEWEAILKMQG
jgi:predicted RNA-binding protein with PUA-like domain